MKSKDKIKMKILRFDEIQKITENTVGLML